METERCRWCGEEIDPEVCWCGEYAKEHSAEHGFVPIGCTCGFDKGGDDDR